MLFNTIDFLVFFTVVTFIYFFLDAKKKMVLLLIASYVFYMAWRPEFLVLILVSTGIDFFAARVMSNKQSRKERKPYLWISVLTNLGLLIFFKYFYFIADSGVFIANALGAHWESPAISIILPMGISFYTFQTLSYSIDVYRGELEAEKSITKFALYVTFFPQLVAGPIERAKNLLSQFHFKYKFEASRVMEGLQIMLWGFFKKVVIADQLSPMVAYVFDNEANAHGFNIYVSTMFFVIQVYCDFSGYSDIAQGAARVLGINLIDNFRYPLFASNFRDLWNRWHLSLTNWYRDYVYFPLGGGKKGILKKYRNIMVVFTVTGFWHGAAWNYVLWGALNGVFLLYSLHTASFRLKLLEKLGVSNRSIGVRITQNFLALHMFALPLVIFLSSSFMHSMRMLNRLVYDWDLGFMDVVRNLNSERDLLLYLGKSPMAFAVILVYIVFLLVVEFRMNKSSMVAVFNTLGSVQKYAFFLFISFSIILMSNVSKTPFVYFQF